MVNGKKPFSGIFRTINKNGEEIAIEYTKGNVVSSHKDGKLFKTFKWEKVFKLYNGQDQDDSYTILRKIKQFDKDGNVVKKQYLNYGEGDGLKRVLTLDFENSKAPSSHGLLNSFNTMRALKI